MQYLKAAAGASESGGAAVTPLSQWARLDRFLILGDEDGTYYAGGRKLQPENAAVLRRCLAEDGARTVQAIAAVRGSGRAPRSDAALWALALAATPAYADPQTNRAALEALPQVARTAADLKKFAGFVSTERGWGRSLRSAIGRWYLEKPARQLAVQMLKERRRGRWSHADLLRLSHPKPANKTQAALFRWAVEGELGRVSSELLEGELKPIHGFEQARRTTDRHELVRLIEDYQLTHEMIPERWLATAAVWEAVLESMPYCAMLRNLGRLTAVGLIAPQGETTALVAARLVDHRRIARAKIHPAALLEILVEYRGRYDVPVIAAALEEAYYASFANVKPAGRRLGLTLDRAALIPSVVMAMLAARTEPGTVGSKPERLDAMMEAVQRSSEAGWRTGAEARVIVISGRECRLPDRPAGMPLVVIAPHADAPVVANADDPWLLQVVGFNPTVPPVVADFVRAQPAGW